MAWTAYGQGIQGACGRGQVSAASKITRGYDAMNRLTSVTTPSGTDNRTYTYDADGRPLNDATTQMGAYNYYDALGHLTARLIGIDGHFWTMHYSYDANGHLSSSTYPDGTTVSYAPDALGRPSQVGSYAHALRYFPGGEPESYTLGNGVTRLEERNTRRLPSNLTYARGNTLLYSHDYQYDANANLTGTTDLVNGQGNRSYGYDALNRLTSAHAPNAWGAETYAYDALNNLRQRVDNGWAFNLNIDSHNRLVDMDIGTQPFIHYQNDARGNRSAMTYQGATTTYTFDALNQLIAIPGTATYAYDAHGRRVRKTRAGKAPKYSFYSNSGKLLYTWDAGTGQGTDYIYLNKTLIARKGAHTVYLLADRLGSPVRETSTAGTLTATSVYSPYGSLDSGAVANEPGFTGHVLDPETHFTYMQARYYDSSAGRFLSPDPVDSTPGDVFNFSRYAYANDNPVVNVDPDGRTCKKRSGDGAGYVCSVDRNNAKWSKKQIKEVNKAYTRAVNRLLKHPDRVAHITVGKITFAVTSKQVANTLIGAWIVTGTEDPSARAGTLGGGLTPGSGHNGKPKTTLYPNVLQRDRAGKTTHIFSDLSRTFIHEGIHETSADAAMMPLYKRDPKRFNNVLHQAPYNQASDWLYGNFRIW